MSLSIYVAAPWLRRAEARAVAEQVGGVDGIVVVSRWLTQHEDSKDPTELCAEAVHDLEDVYKSHALLLLNYEVSEGKSVETGVALALQMPIVAVGKPSNVFHHLPDFVWVDTVEAAIVELLKINLVLAGLRV